MQIEIKLKIYKHCRKTLVLLDTEPCISLIFELFLHYIITYLIVFYKLNRICDFKQKPAVRTILSDQALCLPKIYEANGVGIIAVNDYHVRF